MIPRRRHSHFCVHSGTYGANHTAVAASTKAALQAKGELGARLAQFAALKALKTVKTNANLAAWRLAFARQACRLVTQQRHAFIQAPRADDALARRQHRCGG
mgnify:CR=1 FL=1